MNHMIRIRLFGPLIHNIVIAVSVFDIVLNIKTWARMFSIGLGSSTRDKNLKSNTYLLTFSECSVMFIYSLKSMHQSTWEDHF